ncbi:hypothetical protein ACMFMG_000809 [Clarireedia jacksonii]
MLVYSVPMLVYSVPMSSVGRFRQVIWRRHLMNIRMMITTSPNTSDLLPGINGTNQRIGFWKNNRKGSIADENRNGILPVRENGVKGSEQEKPENIILENHENESDDSELYKQAVELLESRRRMRDPSATATATATSIKVSSDTTEKKVRAQLKGKPRSEGMKEWLKVIGYETPPFYAIHVSGTKGKGSTCTFASSLLTSHSHRIRPTFPPKIGLFISPHLTTLRERILINNRPISASLFATSLFHIWKLLSTLPEPARPRYMQLLDLLSIHVFATQGVQMAVYETHSGGEFDSTRVLGEAVKVAGVAAIGMDHVRVLGPGIEDVAWHKGGIIRGGARAFALKGEEVVERVLRERARERGTEVEFVGEGSVEGRLPIGEGVLETPVMRKNCALAIKLVNELLRVVHGDGESLSNEDIREGVRGFKLLGRFQKVYEGERIWYLDGAHNEMSMPIAADWFAKWVRNSERPHLPLTLLFNNPPTKDRLAIFVQLIAHLKTLSFSPSSQSLSPPPINFIFLSSAKYSTLPSLDSTKDDYLPTSTPILHSYQSVCALAYPGCRISIVKSVKEAIAVVRGMGTRKEAGGVGKEDITRGREGGKAGHILVTGHMVLVGEVLEVFREEGLLDGL